LVALPASRGGKICLACLFEEFKSANGDFPLLCFSNTFNENTLEADFLLKIYPCRRSIFYPRMAFSGILSAVVSYIFQIRFLIIADHRQLRGLRIGHEIVFISPESEAQK